MKKNGIVFYSIKVHRIKINLGKVMLFENVLYIKQDEDLMLIKNVENVKIYSGYLYFKCLGKVEIIHDCSSFYKAFSVVVESKQFDLNQIKQEALKELIYNNFKINFCKITKKYINIIENVLKIKFLKEKIAIFPNKFNLSFILKYKLNNKIKHIYIG